ncbi:HNH endonuclease signature motif containing protein [Rhodococcus aerolatus]
MSTTRLLEALASLDAAAQSVLAESAAPLTEAEVLDAARALEVVGRRLEAAWHPLCAELGIRSTAVRHHERGTGALLAQVLGIDASEGRRRVAAAAQLAPRTSLQGEPQEPLLPATAAAQARGEVSGAHAAVVARTLDALPGSVTPAERTAAAADLAAAAAELTPSQLTAAADRVRVHLDPDGRLTDDRDHARRRSFTVGRQGGDGMTPVRGLLDPRARALLDAAFVALAAPDPAADGSGADGGDGPGADGPGVRDTRSTGQRHHDALAAVCDLAMRAGRVGSAHGSPAAVVLTMGIDDLERRAGRATTATGGTMSVPDALELAADGAWSLLVTGGRGEPLFLGRDQRLATAGQRRALSVRDGGCTRPGCDIPAAWCQVHHLVPWAQGGATDVDAMCLVCAFDHPLVDQGWTLALDDGRVTWTAPAWLDPEQVPRVNLLRHPPDPALRLPLPDGREPRRRTRRRPLLRPSRRSTASGPG